MDKYSDLAERLKEYSCDRKGEIAKLTYDASVAISDLIARVKILEKELADDGK